MKTNLTPGKDFPDIAGILVNTIDTIRASVGILALNDDEYYFRSPLTVQEIYTWCAQAQNITDYLQKQFALLENMSCYGLNGSIDELADMDEKSIKIKMANSLKTRMSELQQIRTLEDIEDIELRDYLIAIASSFSSLAWALKKIKDPELQKFMEKRLLTQERSDIERACEYLNANIPQQFLPIPKEDLQSRINTELKEGIAAYHPPIIGTTKNSRIAQKLVLEHFQEALEEFAKKEAASGTPINLATQLAIQERMFASIMLTIQQEWRFTDLPLIRFFRKPSTMAGLVINLNMYVKLAQAGLPSAAPSQQAVDFDQINGFFSNYAEQFSTQHTISQKQQKPEITDNIRRLCLLATKEDLYAKHAKFKSRRSAGT